MAGTVAYARGCGEDDLAQWAETIDADEADEIAAGWRETSYFSQAPSATASADELAAWIVS